MASSAGARRDHANDVEPAILVIVPQRRDVEGKAHVHEFKLHDDVAVIAARIAPTTPG